jgi:hypothetical protein
VEPDGDPLALFLQSQSAFEALPADTLVLPSHGLPFRGIPVRVAQLRAHHAARLTELENAVNASEAPTFAAELVPLLFRRELDVHQRYLRWAKRSRTSTTSGMRPARTSAAADGTPRRGVVL